MIWHAYHSLGGPVNWTGFYVYDKDSDDPRLILAPFQGKVACQLIQIGKGVCGTAAATLETQVVKDVQKFPGHIACDGETNSEIVVPMHKDGKVLGVLDLDCLALEGFDKIDKEYLEKLVKVVVDTCDWK